MDTSSGRPVPIAPIVKPTTVDGRVRAQPMASRAMGMAYVIVRSHTKEGGGEGTGATGANTTHTLLEQSLDLDCSLWE